MKRLLYILALLVLPLSVALKAKMEENKSMCRN